MNMMVQISVQVPAFDSFGYIQNPEVKLIDHMVILFNFLSSYHTIFHSRCTTLHFHQLCTKVPVSPHHHQHIVLFFDDQYPNVCQMVSCSFDLQRGVFSPLIQTGDFIDETQIIGQQEPLGRRFCSFFCESFQLFLHVSIQDFLFVCFGFIKHE